MAGSRFGKFTIGEISKVNNYGVNYYFCYCDCGSIEQRRLRNINERMLCKSCQGTKKDSKIREFRARGMFDCLSCGGEFPMSELTEPNDYHYRCRKCRSNGRYESKKRRLAAKRLEREKERVGNSISKSLQKEKYSKNTIAYKYLGLDKDEFVSYISSLFREGMSWNNRGEWQLDHIIPLSSAKTNSDIKRLWHYTNLQPLWRHENREKSDLLEWRHFEWAKELK